MYLTNASGIGPSRLPGLGQGEGYLSAFFGFLGLAFLACFSGGVWSIRRSTSSGAGAGSGIGLGALMVKAV